MTTAVSTSSAPLTGGTGVPAGALLRVALLGNPNTGKTTLFNRLTGLRHKTSNFPGTTLEARVGRVRPVTAAAVREAVISLPAGACGCGASDAQKHGCLEDSSPVAPGATAATLGAVELIDLPGVYSLELDQVEAEVCRAVLQGRAAPRGALLAEPGAVCIVADAANLARNLILVGEALRRRLPTVVALNMIDLARRQGLHVDPAALEKAIGCPVVAVSARTGEGLEGLRGALSRARIPNQTPPGTEAGLRAWAEELYAAVAAGEPGLDADTFSDRLDRVVTHPVLGVALFVAIMGGLFYSLFALAKFPMEWISGVFSLLSWGVEAVLPPGDLRELVSKGVVNGIGATLVFVPQIALLFFLISVLEDTGYLARAAFVVDRLLRPFGLPGHAFVPLLSSHACALPGIMATRAIPDRRERLATILVAPFMSCSARLPVYVPVTTVLFRGRPAL